MKFILEMDCDNAAFEPDAKHEIARILRDVVEQIESSVPFDRNVLFDANGNRVGTWRIKP